MQTTRTGYGDFHRLSQTIYSPKPEGDNLIKSSMYDSAFPKTQSSYHGTRIKDIAYKLAQRKVSHDSAE
jgi:hypothetical protein